MTQPVRIVTSQPIRKKWWVRHDSVHVNLERYAYLSPDLRTVEESGTASVSIIIPRDDLHLALDIAEARWLWSALAQALKEA